MVVRLAELQVALPKTQDVSKIVEQLQQRGQVMQEHISAEVRKVEEQKRRKVTEGKGKDNATLQLQARAEMTTKDTNHKKSNHKKQHPFKGSQIDISG